MRIFTISRLLTVAVILTVIVILYPTVVDAVFDFRSSLADLFDQVMKGVPIST